LPVAAPAAGASNSKKKKDGKGAAGRVKQKTLF
jgi:hypothetical protein